MLMSVGSKNRIVFEFVVLSEGIRFARALVCPVTYPGIDIGDQFQTSGTIKREKITAYRNRCVEHPGSFLHPFPSTQGSVQHPINSAFQILQVIQFGDPAHMAGMLQGIP